MQRLDARWKLATFVVAIVGASFANDPSSQLLAAAFAVVLARVSGLSNRRLQTRLLPIILMLCVFFAWAIFRPRPGEQPWVVYGLAISWLAFLTFFAIICKTVAIVVFLATLLDTTPLPELGQGAAALGVPRLFVHLVLLTQRYVFVLAEEFARLRRALRVRGYHSRANRRSFATIGAVAGTLIVRGHERAERVHHAMAARGFDGVFRSLSPARTAPADVVFFAAMLIATSMLIIWDRGWLPS